MRQKEKYIRPIVTDSMELALESAILSASVVDSISSVKTAGQEVENFDMSPGSDFNTSWEE